MPVDIASNLSSVRTMIEEACLRTGRDPKTVTLIAVSKTQPPDALIAAAAAGIVHFGENRVEEAEIKIPIVNQRSSHPLTWHMIGHLQGRKAKDTLLVFDVIESLDTLKLGERLSRLAGETGRTIDVLMEVNVSGETNKYGFVAHNWQENPDIRRTLFDSVRQIASLPGLHLTGLMTMAPIVAQMEETRPIFASLAALRVALQSELGFALPELSMGMTDDFPIAVEEGATSVRVGRAIFGERIAQGQG